MQYLKIAYVLLLYVFKRIEFKSVDIYNFNGFLDTDNFAAFCIIKYQIIPGTPLQQIFG